MVELFILTFILPDLINVVNQVYILHEKAPAFSKDSIITPRECWQQLVCLIAQAKTWLRTESVDLSIIKVTSGWHYKVICLTHITWNVSVNERTRKRARIPDYTFGKRSISSLQLGTEW